MNTPNPSPILAFVAGLASFLSPCVLPLVPAYIGYLSGQAVIAPAGQRTAGERLAILLHALAFVIGFSAVFLTLGAAAGGLGRLLRSDWVRWAGGLVMVFFGLALAGLIRLPFLVTEHRVSLRTKPRWGYLSSLLVGVSFAAGWTPCIGPVLTAILALGTSQETVGQSVGLLAVYSAGLGLPFLLVALAVERATALLQRLQRYLRVIQIVIGILIVLFGVLLFMDWLGSLTGWVTRLGIGWVPDL